MAKTLAAASNLRLLCLHHPWSEGISSSHQWDLPHQELGLPGSSQAAAFSHPITVRHTDKQRGN